MVTQTDIEEHGRKMGYSGKITPYIRSKILQDMESKDKSEDEIETPVKVKTEKKKEKKVKKVSSKPKSKSGLLKRISVGINRTSNYLGECGERYKDFHESTAMVKVAPKKKVRKVKAPKKSFTTSATKPKTKPRKRKVKKTKTPMKTATSIRKSQKAMEKELMEWM